MPFEKTYVKGVSVWIPNEEQGWELAVILETYAAERPQLVVQPASSREPKVLEIASRELLPPLCDPRDAQLDDSENLTALSVVHEATVCGALRARFHHRRLYSHCGVVAVAFNPYAQLPAWGSNEILKHHQAAEPLEPHVFTVAEKAFRNLQRENKDQSIIFSGVTGSGKSVNANQAIFYLTTIDEKAAEIKEKILATLTVTDAFGHAKTAKNEDSSRFGRYFELQYNNDYNIVGANLKTYLLDRSRVVYQPKGEQNFHIFYQLSSAQARFPLLQLSEPDCLAYLNPPENDNTTNNSQSFDKTVGALKMLGFSLKQQEEMWFILSALLHLGNVSFKRLGGPEANEAVESCLVSNLHGLKTVGKLFGLDQKAVQPLRKWLCHKRIVSQQDEVLQPMTVDLATRNRDSFARFLYKKLFSWVVSQINVVLRSTCDVQSSIGILDLYGFENFSSNSFEQLCINYANEKIQQYYVQTLLKTEQEEYVRENIEWTFTRFQDNILCLELIEGKGGIVDIINDETKFSQTAKDSNIPWVHQLHSKCEKSEHFSAWRDGSADFVIHHFIAPVRYDPQTFVDKNRDTAVKELIEVLKDTKNDLLRKFMVDEYSRFTNTMDRKKSALNLRNSPQTKKSVLISFRSSLDNLTDLLKKTSSNFVICIKSNENKKAWYFDSLCVLGQMRAFNILEIVRMSAAGFFKHPSYTNFFDRYHCLLPFEKTERTTDKLLENCVKIIDIYRGVKDFSHIKFGKSKIFLREEDIFELESLRKKKHRRAAVTIQRALKTYLEMRRYWELRRATVWIQNHARRCMKRRRERAAREIRAAIKIQAHVRGHLTRQWYRKLISGYTNFKLYATVRVAAIVKRELENQMKNVFATLIQSAYRGHVARRRYLQMRRSAIVIQAWYRGHLGRKVVKKLKEQRKKQKKLESKLDDLQDKINLLIQTHLTPEELAEMHRLSDDALFVQAKNKALNRVLFEKIQALKALRGKPPKRLRGTSKKIIQEDDEAAHRTLRKNEDKENYLSKIPSNKENYSEKSQQSDVISTQEVSTSAEELMPIIPEKGQETSSAEKLMPITPEKEQEETYEPTKITASNEEITTEDTVEAIQFDATEAQEVSALQANQESPPVPCQKKSNKLCELPELDLNTNEENYDDVVHFTTASAEEVFKSLRIEDSNNYSYMNNDYDYIKIIEAYNKFDIRSEGLRQAIKLGDFELMKQKMLNRNSEISKDKLKPKLPKAKSFTDTMLDIAYERPQKPNDDSEEDVFVEAKENKLGIIQYDIAKCNMSLVYHLVIELEPSTILQFNRVLPAAILFMCVRYLDSLNDCNSVVVMFGSYKKAIEGLIAHLNTFDALAIWLNNTWQLLNFFRQYSKEGSSGWEIHHMQNTERQKQHHLLNLNSDCFEGLLHQIGNLLFKHILQFIFKAISAMIIPAVVDNDQSFRDDVSEEERSEESRQLLQENHLYQLLNKLTLFYDVCVSCGVASKLIKQIFQHVFAYISASALNNFLSRKEVITDLKGSQIRLNLVALQKWATHRHLTKANVSLGPIIHATRLLVLLPFESAVLDEIIVRVEKLTYKHMFKVIAAYKPLQEIGSFDQHNSMQILRSKIMEEALNKTGPLYEPSKITVDLSFEYSPIHFDELEIPKEYDAAFLHLT